MNASPPAKAVTFDFGQTLAELDCEMLAARLGERGVHLSPRALERQVRPAFLAYSRAIQQGAGGHPWGLLMRSILEPAGVPSERVGELVAWLWREQPSRNLWRRPIAPMLEVVRDLVAAHVPVGVISNSEGGLSELAAEMGIADLFQVVADSGRLHMEKPGREIFEYAATKLGVACPGVVHIGDAFAADVVGALQAGMRAIWYEGDAARENIPETVHLQICHSAADVRRALRRWGLPIAEAKTVSLGPKRRPPESGEGA